MDKTAVSLLLHLYDAVVYDRSIDANSINDVIQSEAHVQQSMYSDAVPYEIMLDYLQFAYSLEQGVGDDQGMIRGPFQFSPVAWKEAGEGEWQINATDLVWSTRAAIKFYYINRERHNKQFSSHYSKEIAYLYHNQGPSAAKHFLRTGELRFPEQSNAALKVFASI